MTTQLKLEFGQLAAAGATDLTLIKDEAYSRLHYAGAPALSLIELLSVLVDSGEAAVQIVNRYKTPVGLARAPLAELAGFKGVGAKKAAKLKAGFELGARALTPSADERPQIKSPADAANLVMVDMMSLDQEEMWVFLLDTRNRLQDIKKIYKGSLNTTMVRVGELFKDAVRANSAAVIVFHNHPSGDPSPSPEDVSVTQQIVSAGKLLDIDVLDHIVVGQARWVSLRERNLGF